MDVRIFNDHLRSYEMYQTLFSCPRAERELQNFRGLKRHASFVQKKKWRGNKKSSPWLLRFFA